MFWQKKSLATNVKHSHCQQFPSVFFLSVFVPHGVAWFISYTMATQPLATWYNWMFHKSPIWDQLPYFRSQCNNLLCKLWRCCIDVTFGCFIYFFFLSSIFKNCNGLCCLLLFGYIQFLKTFKCLQLLTCGPF